MRNLPVARGEDLVSVGRVGRWHGTDGAFVVERASEDAGRYAVGSTLYVDGSPATVVLSRRVGGGRVAVKLDRPVERGQSLAVLRTDLPLPADGGFYVYQLVGLEVVEEGRGPIGRVRDVLTGVANDNLELEDGSLLPLVEDCVSRIDLDEGRIIVAPGFWDGR